ncbi:MAG: 4-(cytidine 5'-diphospho)-2-C-methyl-D-erythritol kinase [Planctomycetes bacterium]|nr:4-(cytidine 5'-diphospho)-2-C-methyl-D-erythritol kinase [Planctomycetota bacterium]
MTLPAASIKIQAPAKLNLFLEVLGRRSDGYHDLESIFQAISIYDHLTVGITSSGAIDLSCSDKTLETPDNLAFKAAQAFVGRTGFGGGIEIYLEKGIPVQAGLGGGSSDAAAVLVALDVLTGASLGAERLRELGAGIGSDVPFFIEGGTALVRGRGERVENVDIPGKLYFVVLFAGFGISTGDVYKNLKLKLTPETESAKVLWGLLLTGEVGSAGQYFFNRLKQPAYELDGRLLQAETAMRRCVGGARVTLCGSGAGLFSAFADRDRAFEAYRALTATNPGEIFLAEGVGRRALSESAKGDRGGNL